MKKNHPTTKLAGLLAAFTFIASSLLAADTVLTLDLTKPGVKVSPMLYGLMTEEINYSYDGGLYAELIRNRVFKDDPKDPVHWTIVQAAAQDKPDGMMALDSAQPLNDALPVSLRLNISRATELQRVGVANDGYWGIPVKPNTTYRASFYARTDGSFSGPLTASIESNDGAKVFAQAVVPKIEGGWQKYSVTLTTDAGATPTAATRFVLSAKSPGTVWLNLVSLFPPTFNDRPNGNRIDIMQLLDGMKPKFLRFPGGNFLEGDLIEDRYPWKKTLGGLEQRPGHAGCWSYRASDGMGLLEFLEWCEDLKMEPLLAVYAGYSLKGDHVEPGPALEPFVQDALDEIEYVTGDKSTKWGAERAKNGHPEPFKLTYVEIGNEDGFDKSKTYDGRFTQFHDAIKAKYPKLQLISTVGGKDGLGKRQPIKSRRPDLFDEHYYRNAGEMMESANQYDNYDRKSPKIFVGEWATREGSPTTNMNAALGDAAWMTGMERNSDHVVIASYAPLFVNVNPGGMQWKSNLIGYDTLNSYGSPSYYAQKMFGTYLGDTVVPISAENVATKSWQPPAKKNQAARPPKDLPVLFFVATRATDSGTIFLKVVNAADTAQSVRINLQGAQNVLPDGVSVVLSSAKPEDTNSITEPEKIVPVTAKVGGLGKSFTHTFAPYSVNVLQIETKR
jgi:alpha-N-arabinofuranosidase